MKYFTWIRASPSYLYSCTHVCLKTEQLISPVCVQTIKLAVIIASLIAHHMLRFLRLFQKPDTEALHSVKRMHGDTRVIPPPPPSLLAPHPHNQQRTDCQMQPCFKNNQGGFRLIKIHLPYSNFFFFFSFSLNTKLSVDHADNMSPVNHPPKGGKQHVCALHNSRGRQPLCRCTRPFTNAERREAQTVKHCPLVFTAGNKLERSWSDLQRVAVPHSSAVGSSTDVERLIIKPLGVHAEPQVVK